MSKTKILTISTSGLGKKEGISTVIIDNYALFDKNRFQLDMVASGSYSYQLVTEFQNIGVNIRCLPSRKISVVRYITALIKLMRREKYDAIYLHGSSAILSIELVTARLCGCKIRVVHSHNTTCDHKMADKLLRPIFYRNYTVALACGREAGQWLYGERPFNIIKNGRNTNVYNFNFDRRVCMRNKLGVSEQTLVLGHVGNFNVQKNQAFLLDVVEQLLKVEKNLKLYLMGDGVTRKKITQMVEERGLRQYIEFTGSIQNVPDMLQAMDLMLMPSLHEGLPLVAVEWQMMGLPCVLSDKITMECAFTNLIRFLPIDSAEKWKNAIIEIKKNQIDRIVSSKSAISAAKENGYDLNSNAQKLQRYFVKKELTNDADN